MSSKKSSTAHRAPNILAPLRETKLLATIKPALPAEIIAMIVDFLPVCDLLRFARTSRRMREMVYDDTRWIQRLKSMGCWNETEARQRLEQSMRQKVDAQRGKDARGSSKTPAGSNKAENNDAGVIAHVGKSSMTLFDSNWEDQSTSVSGPQSHTRQYSLDMAPESATSPDSLARRTSIDSIAALKALTNVRSLRGSARQEYGKVYKALGPLYFNLQEAQSHEQVLVYRVYPRPEDQAQIFANLKTFSQSDWAQGCQQRETTLESIAGGFENALLREFEKGCDAQDYDGRMKRYANVLVTLNGGTSGFDAFIQHSRLMREKDRLGNPYKCLDGVAQGHADLGPSRDFFQYLAKVLNEELLAIDHVFPRSVDVMIPFLNRVGEDIISEYITALFDEAHKLQIESYLKAVSGVFEQSVQFVHSLKPPPTSSKGFSDKMMEMIVRIFEPHIDLYLAEEVHFFRDKSHEEVNIWEKQLSEQEASAESFFMSNISRQADKRDFLTSFKKVVMMPVNVLPSIPSAFAVSKPTIKEHGLNGSTPGISRPNTPSLTVGSKADRPTTPNREAPSTELAAKALIMNSKLEGIRSLFSIEVALNLVHKAKTSIERAARLTPLGGQWSEEAKMQCETVFVDLLEVLGFQHIKPGFDKAVNHLSTYNARTVGEHSQSKVEPLVTFLELVNVGDLIQQMIDVFYAQELVAKKLTDPDDFLDPAVKEKKKFEQMLDERVAAGLNKGIDVLMDEVEYVFATTQLATDFNPSRSADSGDAVYDIGMTSTAKQVIELVSYHTGMLIGSTDKNVLDVFNQEVGMRLFTAICKHLKRQRISTEGAIKLICDVNHYYDYIQKLKNKELLQYFRALRELSSIYLIDPALAKETAAIIADGDRYQGIFRAEEVYEFAERRADWYQIKKTVEKSVYGVGCLLM